MLVITYTRNDQPQMDKIISTLERAANLLNDYADYYSDNISCDKGLDEIRDTEDALTVLIDNFKQVQKEVEEMFKTYHAEGESETHLVQDPSGGETLADTTTTEEDDLKVLVLDKDTKIETVPAEEGDPEYATFEIEGQPGRWKRELQPDDECCEEHGPGCVSQPYTSEQQEKVDGLFTAIKNLNLKPGDQIPKELVQQHLQGFFKGQAMYDTDSSDEELSDSDSEEEEQRGGICHLVKRGNGCACDGH